MADLLIPLLLLFAILGGVLIWALVRQLRELDGGSDRPFGGWQEGGPDPELPWRREKADRPTSGQGQRQASSGRPTLPWQRGEGQRQPDRPRPGPQPMPQPARPEPRAEPARPEPSPQPAREQPAPQPAAPALPRRGGQEKPERGRRRRPRQPAWLTLPGQQRGEEPARERPRPASQPQPRPQPRAEKVAPDRPAPLWQGRSETPEERPATAPSSARCSTCGGTGEAIVSQPGGGLARGPCPVCQR